MASLPRKPDSDQPSAEAIAYPVLYKRHLSKTLRWLRYFGVLKRHQEDVAQDVWMRVLRALESYQPDRPFEPWLMTIASRAASDHLKQADVRRERLSKAGEIEPQAIPPMVDRMIDAIRTLETVFQQLSYEHREVLMMVDLEEQDPSEVATALGVPVNTVYSRLDRARTELQRALERVRAAEARRLGAAVALPAFLLDWRALLEAGRDVPPVSEGTASRIWEGIQRALGNAEPHVPQGSSGLVAPPRPSSSPSSLFALARWPLSSPVGLAATMIASGLAGAGLDHWLHEPAFAPPPAIVHEGAASGAQAGPTMPEALKSAPTVMASSARYGAGSPAYDPREELLMLEAAWALYTQGKCEAARAKLVQRPARIHAKDYGDLLRKIDACLAGAGGSP